MPLSNMLLSFNSINHFLFLIQSFFIQIWIFILFHFHIFLFKILIHFLIIQFSFINALVYLVINDFILDITEILIELNRFDFLNLIFIFLCFCLLIINLVDFKYLIIRNYYFNHLLLNFIFLIVNFQLFS